MIIRQNLINRAKSQNKKLIYVKISEGDLSLLDLPSAGPNPNITGMRNQYWGKNAILARQGRYVYKLT